MLFAVMFPVSMSVIGDYFSHKPIKKWKYSTPLGKFFSFPPNMTLIKLQPEALVGLIKGALMP